MSGRLLSPANAISAMTAQMAVRLVGILIGKRPVKRHFKDDEEFGGKKKFGDRSFKKPFKRRGKDDFED